MGSGAFGSNGSVHWKIVHTADQANGGFIHGRDPDKDGGSVYSQGVYRLRLRFHDDAAARQALADAARKVNGGIAEVLVPAIKRQKETDDLPWEIEIYW